MAKATLTILTPVHVGSGQVLNKNMDFGIEEDKVGFFDLDKIVNLIGLDQISQLTNIIENDKPILDFLRNGRGIKNPLEDFCSHVSKIKNISSSTGQLKEHYRTSMRGVCIPGSSLKGAIKTAIFSSLADDTFLRSVKTDNLGFWKSKNNNPKWTWKDSQIEDKLFGRNANEKTTRFLKFGDIHFPHLITEVHESAILDKMHRGWGFKDERFLLEVIPERASTEFELKINEQLFNQNISKYPEKWIEKNTAFIKKGIFDLCEMVRNSTLYFVDSELSDFSEEKLSPEGAKMIEWLEEIRQEIESCKDNQCIIRVGANSGWVFTTGGWVKSIPVENMNESEYNALRYVVQKKDYSNMNLWPKTRKVTSNGIPFGFVKISLQS